MYMSLSLSLSLYLSLSIFWSCHIFWSECDIRENFDTNECPNIFVSTKLHEWISEYIHTNFFDTNECPNKYSYWKLHEYSYIFEYSSRFYTLTHSPTNVRIYSYKQIWHERMSEYIRKRKIDTNECPNIYSWPIYSNIRIFEYIPHTLYCVIHSMCLCVWQKHRYDVLIKWP